MKKSAAEYNWKNYMMMILFSAVLTAGVMYLSVSTRFYLNGNSINGQMYKLEVMREALKTGSWYPLFVERWYNGYEIFRCTSPVPYLFIALLSELAGSVDMGITIFYGTLVVLVMTGFFRFGIRWKRMFAAGLIGAAFLFLPSIVYVALWNGSFDVLLGIALMPCLMCSALEFLEQKDRKALISFSILLALLIASHYLLAFTFGMTGLVYLVLRMVIRNEWQFEMALAANLVLLYVVMAYFLYPAITGGLFERDYSVIGQWNVKTGVVLLIAAGIGLFLSERKRVAGFVTTILAVGISFDVFEPVLRLLPSEALQQPHWYLLTGTVFALMTLLNWKRLRMVILAVLLGCVLSESLPLIFAVEDGDKVLMEEQQQIEDYLIDQAVSLTNNRIAVLDDGMLGDAPHYYIASHGVNSMYGWDVENGLTTREQLNLIESFTDGFYEYMFGATLLYGNDVVVVIKELLTEEAAYDELITAANGRGYEVVCENENAVVLKAGQVTSTYGVTAVYENLAIGEYANSIAYIYPSFGVGRSSCLEDYTVEELAGYKRLYLSGFSYREKAKAESLLREVAAKGVKIYIDMQHIPKNKLTGKDEFMEIYAQFIQFTEDFPVLATNNGNQFKLSFQTTTDTTWNTVYVSGCTEVIKEATYEKKKHLAYVGRGRDENITFMGFNLAFYYLAIQNKDLKLFLDETFEIYEETLPELELVPIEVEYLPEQIRVVSPQDKVNCNIASVETLLPDRIITEQENMWVVNEQETLFAIKRPDSTEGMFIGALGLIGMMLLWIVVYVVLETGTRKNK